MHADDNLIESRLRQLEGRTGTTGPLSRSGATGNMITPPGVEPFWPQPIKTSPATPATTNRWLGPILGIVVGSVITQLIASFGATADRTPVTQAAVATPSVATSDPTTQALSRLIAAQPAAQAAIAPLRSIDRNEMLKLQKTKRLNIGRQDPFADVMPMQAKGDPQALPQVQVLVPDPPAAPLSTPAPRPTSQIRFNGSMSSDGVFTALVEEISQGQTSMRRWHLGDTVLGGYRVAEIGLRSLKLRLGQETIFLSAGSTQDLIRRDGHVGLSALAPEPMDDHDAPQARPAVWRSTPAPARPNVGVAPPAMPATPALPVPPPEPAMNGSPKGSAGADIPSARGTDATSPAGDPRGSATVQ